MAWHPSAYELNLKLNQDLTIREIEIHQELLFITLTYTITVFWLNQIFFLPGCQKILKTQLLLLMC